MGYISKTMKQRRSDRRKAVVGGALRSLDALIAILGICLVAYCLLSSINVATRPAASGDVTVNRGH